MRINYAPHPKRTNKVVPDTQRKKPFPYRTPQKKQRTRFRRSHLLDGVFAKHVAGPRAKTKKVCQVQPFPLPLHVRVSYRTRLYLAFTHGENRRGYRPYRPVTVAIVIRFRPRKRPGSRHNRQLKRVGVFPLDHVSSTSTTSTPRARNQPSRGRQRRPATTRNTAPSLPSALTLA